MKRLKLAMCAAALAMAAGTASATPLRLDYCVEVLPSGLYQYTFTLTNDNHDGSWAPGQGWDWFIFGDVSGMTPPLSDFAMITPFPIGPWTSLSSSGGGHNGPTFAPVTGAYWIPNAVGDSLTWQGTSARFVDEPAMLFSTLIPTGPGTVPADFEVAHRIACSGAPQGACCYPNGSCSILSSGSCTNLSGIYRGDGSVCATANCPQPPTGSCCRDSGCAIVTQAICVATGGTYNGNNSTCATANCPPATAYLEGDDVGELPETSATVNNGTGTLLNIHGTLQNYTDADMYKIRVCDPANFSALMTGLNFGAELFLFTSDGVGITNRMQFNGLALLTNQFTASLSPGEYYIAAAAFLKMPQDEASQYLWITDHFDNIERAPDGPGASNPIDHWDAGGGVDGAYNIALTGACFLGNTPAACYANCDNSTNQPCLNVLDFSCFLNKFAAGESYANCDNSTNAPVLNVLDFSCFLNQFAAGCSSC